MAGERGVEEFEMSLERTQARCPRHRKDGKLECAGSFSLRAELRQPVSWVPPLLYPFRES